MPQLLERRCRRVRTSVTVARRRPGGGGQQRGDSVDHTSAPGGGGVSRLPPSLRRSPVRVPRPTAASQQAQNHPADRFRLGESVSWGEVAGQPVAHRCRRLPNSRVTAGHHSRVLP